MSNDNLARVLESKIDLEELKNNAIKKIEELFTSGFVKEAELIAKQLLVVDPENQAGLQLYGIILSRSRQYKDAVELFEKAISLNNKNSENYNNLALCYMHLNDFTKAISNIENAISIKKSIDYIANYAMIKRASGDNLKAIDIYQSALQIDENNHKILQCLGSCYGQEKRYDEAIVCFKKALDINPEFLDAHVDLAYAYHLTGQWDKAWDEYEYRLEYWHSAGRNPGRFLSMYKKEKNWDGKASLKDKKIVLYCEQGFGDMIQFIRFAPKLKELGAEVLIDAPDPLKSLFSNFGIVRQGYSPDGYDYHCSVLSLPYLLNMKTPDKFLSSQYIFNDSKLDMTDYKNTYNIGICWAGNPGHPNDGNRSCHLSNFRCLSNIPGVKLFSLQKEAGKRVYVNMPDIEIDLSSGCEDMSIVDLSEFMVNYEATCALINSLDLIITVDTSLLHLAGAMGKNTFALIPNNPDWRWTSEGDKTVWYDNVTLFRQEYPGDWTHVLEKIGNKIKNESILQNK